MHGLMGGHNRICMSLTDLFIVVSSAACPDSRPEAGGEGTLRSIIQALMKRIIREAYRATVTLRTVRDTAATSIAVCAGNYGPDLASYAVEHVQACY